MGAGRARWRGPQVFEGRIGSSPSQNLPCASLFRYRFARVWRHQYQRKHPRFRPTVSSAFDLPRVCGENPLILIYFFFEIVDLL